MRDLTRKHLAAILVAGFSHCEALQQIRIPDGCTLDADVFEGCGTVLVFSHVGSSADDYCAAHANCIFVPESISR